ncbi:MAG: imidazole glycerol phosphate synthase subunit HisH [Clostridiales Family XIII bacterium]|jgi:glutamine amidotransferase|nr:imidazole glycerol phosphate synthase subunit HisH [Clostridiales Family XIII bacterium]
MIAIIDYGAGNLFSVKNALDFLGFENGTSAEEADLRKADLLILPGVGAFPDAMRMLRGSGLVRVIREEAKRKPLLGICLGMQLLFERGYEFEETEGLGLIEGYVDKLVAPGRKIPHMGWDDTEIVHPCPLTAGTKSGDMVYFVHSYKAVTDERNIGLSAFYGEEIPALVFSGHVYGAQFHPEKSGSVGLNILKNFALLQF